jgi:hypothetical protein
LGNVRTVRTVPWWGLLSSVAAPVLLVGGWTIAAQRQPAGFDTVRDTISALAARDATDRWLMTVALLGVGVCHLVTAAALRPAAVPGRVVLATGGIATVAVALFPLPSGDGRSGAHSVAAAVAFVSLTLWPAGSTPRGSAQTPVTAWPLRRTGSPGSHRGPGRAARLVRGRPGVRRQPGRPGRAGCRWRTGAVAAGRRAGCAARAARTPSPAQPWLSR